MLLAGIHYTRPPTGSFGGDKSVFEILYKKLFVKLIVVENNLFDKAVQIYKQQNKEQEVSLRLL